MTVGIDDSGWTYGAEHEWGDWSLDAKLPKGCAHNKKDYTCVNSNGIANDPRGLTYRFGGEINTPPTSDLTAQVEIMLDLVAALPNAVVNYRSNLHIHIRVPGLREDLDMLKRLTIYNQNNIAKALELVEPIPEPTRLQGWPSEEEYLGARRRWKRRRVSHHTILPPDRVLKQLQARTTKEFFEAEVPRSKARAVMWHASPRCAVNVRQLLETDTIEFRHFPGTLKSSEMLRALLWCWCYMQDALSPHPMGVDALWEVQTDWDFPRFPEYCHWQEKRYRATCHDGSLTRETIARNIALIKAGNFPKD